jgi:sulfate adenylyltransferase subunit 1 (EFTu-like GTPase family)
VQELDLSTNTMEVKDGPKYVKSFQSCRVRITTKIPLAMEKFEVLPQLGRFTLRDEGRTIGVGKILKYKPHKVESNIQVAGAVSAAAKDKNEALVFDMETGETSKQKKALESVAEE